MNALLPYTPRFESEPTGERRVKLGEDATDVIEALQSETARELLAALHDAPETPSGLARINDASLQTVCYHLQKLREAELVRVIDRCYSTKGREMDVYGPASHRLILDVAPGPDQSNTERAPRSTG